MLKDLFKLKKSVKIERVFFVITDIDNCGANVHGMHPLLLEGAAFDLCDFIK